MLVISSKKYTALMSSKIKEAYSELKNAKDLGARFVRTENSFSNQRVLLYDSNNNRIGCIIGESGTIINTLVEKESNIDKIIASLKELICRNNNIIQANNGKLVRKTYDYTKDVE